jgi:hypothetical protein
VIQGSRAFFYSGILSHNADRVAALLEEVPAKQSDVAVVRLKIHVEDGAENWDASYDRIKQHITEHAGDQAISSTAVSGSKDDVSRDNARRGISEYGHEADDGIKSKTDRRTRNAPAAIE